MAFLLALVFILLSMLLKRKKVYLNQANLMKTLIDNFIPTLGLEKNLDLILLKTQELVEAENYSFYIFNSSNKHFTLKAVRQLINNENIAPSYSRLLPYEKERFSPPLSLPLDSVPSKASVIQAGDVPLICIPTKGGKGLIRIGPIKKVKKSLLKDLDYFGELLESPLNNLIDEEEQKRTYEVMRTSTKAVKYINNLFIHDNEYIKLLVQTCVKGVEPVSSLLIVQNQVIFTSGISNQLGKNLNENANKITSLKQLIGEKPFAIILNTNRIHGKLKELLGINVGNYSVYAQFTLTGKQYVLLLNFEKASAELEGVRQHLFKALLNNIQQFIKMKQDNPTVSLAYVELLKSIADMIDNTSPFTIGYSKLMSRYSMAIANELGLSEIQVKTIGLAAYLSNIGTIGLADGLLTKEGKYSEEEYEQMKLHSEVGATIVENTIVQDEVSKCIRYHHERIDGNGYPYRLRGEEIPVGSKIILIVQTFLAKINGRQYRDPLPFDEAIKLLRNAAGTQLDPQILHVFIGWYSKRRDIKLGQNKALGNCWDLSCSSQTICTGCPAYGVITKNCWEQDSNNCKAHGKSCKTCFIYTETQARLKNVKKV
jgi:HD-GYP domain-containing protein (c-di-GMP phosphodiesterase class II)